MYFKDFLEQYQKEKIQLYVDMDGVLADYVVGEPKDYHIKRPLYTSITKLEEIAQMENVELFILSITRMTEGIAQKNEWLDKYAPFFKPENRVIISREANDFVSSWKLKADYIKSIENTSNRIMVIDDDPIVLKEIGKNSKEVVLLKDTVLVD